MITTNYNLKDWSTLSIYVLLVFTIPFLACMMVLYTVLMPVIGIMPDMNQILSADGFLVTLRDSMLEQGHPLNLILFYMILTVAGAPVLAAIATIWTFFKTFDLMVWYWKVTKITLKDMILYRDGIDVTTTKWWKKWMASSKSKHK